MQHTPETPQTVLQPSNAQPSHEPKIKLTKSGVPRKPYVKTPAREAAFQKCRDARQKKLEEQKRQATQQIEETAPTFSQQKFDEGTVQEKEVQLHELRKAKAKLQAQKIVEAMTQGNPSSKDPTEEQEEQEENTEEAQVPMEEEEKEHEQNNPSPAESTNTKSEKEQEPEHEYDEMEETFTSDSELDPEYARQVRKFIRREVRGKQPIPAAPMKKKVRIVEDRPPMPAQRTKVTKRYPDKGQDHHQLADSDDEEEGYEDNYHEEDDHYSYEPLRVPRERPTFASYKARERKHMNKRARRGYTPDQLEFIWL